MSDSGSEIDVFSSNSDCSDEEEDGPIQEESFERHHGDDEQDIDDSTRAIDSIGDDIGTNEDLMIRFEFAEALKNCEQILNGQFNLFDTLRYEMNNGLFSTDDVDLLFDEEERAKDRTVLRMEMLENALQENWSSLTDNTRRQAISLFESAGLASEDDDTTPDDTIDRSRILVKNDHIICSKYHIEGDDYFYNFIPVATIGLSYEHHYCLSIGSCSFFPAYQHDKFRYDIYLKLLDKHILVKDVPPIVFNPTTLQNPEDFFPCEEDESMILDATWVQTPKREDLYSPQACEKSLYSRTLVLESSVLQRRYDQAAMIENMNESEYCILSFGQFQQLSGLFMRTVTQAGKRDQISSKLDGKIMVKHLKCQVGEPFGCTRKTTLVVDALHRIVLMRSSGKHHFSKCKMENKKKCYLAYRNIMLANNYKNIVDDTVLKVKSQYEEVFSLLGTLGVYPTAASMRNWARHSKAQEPCFEVPPAMFKNYTSCCQLLAEELNNGRVLTRGTGGIRSVSLGTDMIIHSFSYQDNSNTQPGIIYSSKSSLEALAESSWWSADATFNLLKDTQIKFITISFKRIKSGYKSQVFLGAIASLPGTETTHNYTVLFREVTKMIELYTDSPLSLKTIITDESNAEMKGIRNAFEHSVEVVNCMWHKGLTFEKHANCAVVKRLRSALNAVTETDFYAEFANLAVSVDKSFREIEDLIRQNVSSEKPVKHKWVYYFRDRAKKIPLIKMQDLSLTEAKKKYFKMISYLHKLWITRRRWALFARDGFSQHEPALLASRSKEMHAALSLKNPFYSQGKKKCEEVFISIITSHGINFRYDPNDKFADIDIQELIEEGSKEEAVLKDIEMARSLEGTALSTQASETMHASLKYNHVIKHIPTLVDLTDKLILYFMKQDARLISLPPKEAPHKYIAGMSFLAKLNDAEAHVFIKEHKALHSVAKKLNMQELLRMNDSRVFDPKCVQACQNCSVCTALLLPCRHTMSNLMYHLLNKDPSLSETSKLNIVRYNFVKKLDDVLMMHYFPTTWNRRQKKKNNDVSVSEGNNVDVDMDEDEHISDEEFDNEPVEEDDVGDSCVNVAGEHSGERYALSEELRVNIQAYIENWTRYDPDSDDLLGYLRTCSNILRDTTAQMSDPLGPYCPPIDVADDL